MMSKEGEINKLVERHIQMLLHDDPYWCVHSQLLHKFKRSLTQNTRKVDDDDNSTSQQMLLLNDLSQTYEQCWSEINCGRNWKQVKTEWRSLFALSCWLMNLLVLRDGMNREMDFDEWLIILKRCDLALILGDDTFSEVVHELVECVHDHVVKQYPLSMVVPNRVNSTSEYVEQRLSELRDLRVPSTQLAVVRNLSLNRFQNEYMKSNTPVIIEMDVNDIDHELIDFNHLVRLAGYRTVPVEIGEDYLAEDWSQSLLFLHEYIRDYLLTETTEKKGYLAQHTLFEQIRPLRKYLQEPVYCAAGEGMVESVNAWIGPIGTKSPLHTDPHWNVLVQLLGSKYVRLYSSQYNNNLYPRHNDVLNNSSQIRSLDSVDTAKFPLFSNTPCWEGILYQGQILFIPKHFWHYIESLDISFSVSFWFE